MLSEEVSKERIERMTLSTDYEDNYLYYIPNRDFWDVASLDG